MGMPPFTLPDQASLRRRRLGIDPYIREEDDEDFLAGPGEDDIGGAYAEEYDPYEAEPDSDFDDSYSGPPQVLPSESEYLEAVGSGPPAYEKSSIGRRLAGALAGGLTGDVKVGRSVTDAPNLRKQQEYNARLESLKGKLGVEQAQAGRQAATARTDVMRQRAEADKTRAQAALKTQERLSQPKPVSYTNFEQGGKRYRFNPTTGQAEHMPDVAEETGGGDKWELRQQSGKLYRVNKATGATEDLGLPPEQSSTAIQERRLGLAEEANARAADAARRQEDRDKRTAANAELTNLEQSRSALYSLSRDMRTSLTDDEGTQLPDEQIAVEKRRFEMQADALRGNLDSLASRTDDEGMKQEAARLKQLIPTWDQLHPVVPHEPGFWEKFLSKIGTGGMFGLKSPVAPAPAPAASPATAPSQGPPMALPQPASPTSPPRVTPTQVSATPAAAAAASTPPVGHTIQKKGSTWRWNGQVYEEVK